MLHRFVTKNEWKCRRKGWCCLNWWKANFSNRICITKTEYSTDLIECDPFSDSYYILVHSRTFSTNKINFFKFQIETISNLYGCTTNPIKSKSEKMKVLFTSNPMAIMSLAFSLANFIACSTVKSFHNVFSSSVN